MKQKRTLEDVLNDETMTPLDLYNFYIKKSDEWQSVRDMVLNRDNHTCRCCGRTADDLISGKPVNLTVHHCTYKNLFNEKDNLNDLITLCQLCHRQIHSHPGNRQRFILKNNKTNKTL